MVEKETKVIEMELPRPKVLNIEGLSFDDWSVSIDFTNSIVHIDNLKYSFRGIAGSGVYLGKIDVRHEFLDNVFALQRYITAKRYGTIRSLITNLIYRVKNDEFNAYFAIPLALGMAIVIRHYPELREADVITFIPAHHSEYRNLTFHNKPCKYRRNEEEFPVKVQHMEFIAYLVHVFAEKPLVQAFAKKKAFKMKDKTLAERREVVKEAYSIIETSIDDLKEKRVIIIDDIYTTGTTLNYCAMLLKTIAGSKRVYGVVAGRAY